MVGRSTLNAPNLHLLTLFQIDSIKMLCFCLSVFGVPPPETKTIRKP